MTHNYEDIKEKVYALVADQLNKDAESFKHEQTLEDLGADSIDKVEIVMKLEEAFGKEISDKDAEQLKTLDDIVNFLSKD